MTKRIYLDMDGTVADFYAVEGWLPMLIAEQTTPYEVARPLGNMNTLAKRLNKLAAEGWEINIISWGSKGASDEYLERIAVAKKRWLKRHLGSVKFTNIHIVHYGTPKQNFASKDGLCYLFDDEEKNRKAWNGENRIAYTEAQLLPMLKANVK